MNPQRPSRLVRIFILQIVFTAALIAVHSPQTASQENRTKIRISNAGFTITALPLLAAKDWGVFSANGLDIENIFMEGGGGPGPYGAKGMGEGGVLPVAPVICNGVFAATGARVQNAPLTPDKVWKAIRKG